MIVAALAVIGGGGAGAYFYFQNANKDITEKNDNALAGKDSEEKSKQTASKEKVKKEPFEFVELDPLILPILDENGVSQVISMIVALEVGDASSAEKVKKYSPRLKNAFIKDMYGVLNRYAALKGGIIKASSVKKRLENISDNVLGDDIIQGVMLQVVQQRPV